MKFFSIKLGSKGVRLNYKMTVFAICLIISTLIWLLIKLSDNYTTEISFPIKYINAPPGKILISEVDSTLSISLQDKGYTIAALNYLNRKTPFIIDLSKLRLHRKGRHYEARINTLNLSQSLSANFGFEGEIFSIYPDTLHFLFENKDSKVIPVQTNFKIEFKKQYFLYDSIQIEPAEVTISGLGSEIDAINFVSTQHLDFNNLDDSLHGIAKLVKPKESGDISIDPESVKFIIPVEKFTESEITVPISEKNGATRLRLKLFPEVVKITYLVALRDFKKISPDKFHCTVDLSSLKENENKKIQVSLDTYPKFVKIIRIQPSSVDYLILK